VRCPPAAPLGAVAVVRRSPSEVTVVVVLLAAVARLVPVGVEG
jgi:hypothetical protein